MIAHHLNQIPLADRYVAMRRSDNENPVGFCTTPIETLHDFHIAASKFMRDEVLLGKLGADCLEHLAFEVIGNHCEILGFSVRDSRFAPGSSLEWQFVLIPAELLPPPTTLH